MAFFCEKGAHRSVAACHQDAWILRAMGFDVLIVDLCKWHHKLQFCQRTGRDPCRDCDPDNALAVDMYQYGVQDFFEAVLVTDAS